MASKLAHLRTTLLFPTLHFFPLRRCSSAPAAAAPSHPWPEWIEFVDWLTAKGYFTEEESNKDMGIVKEACFSFARERYDHIGSLSRDDIEVIARDGCPSTLRNVVNSGKRLRAYIGLNEKDVCGSCNLRGNCDRAYMTLQDSESAAQTLDVMRLMLFYALDHNVVSGFEKPAGREVVEVSTRKMFSELLRLSQEACAPAPSIPIAPVHEMIEQPLSSKDENQGFDEANMNFRNWFCPKCNCLNLKQNSHCDKCKEGRPKRDPTTRNATQEGDWHCPNCSFVNFPRTRRCLFCKADGPNVAERSSMKKGDWICIGCRLMNFDCYRCKGCKKPRPKRLLSLGEKCPICGFVNPRKNRPCPKGHSGWERESGSPS